ncbi:MAG: tetratricopeptide repeat protein [Wenzhouxiangellaceae bacterium]
MRTLHRIGWLMLLVLMAGLCFGRDPGAGATASIEAMIAAANQGDVDAQYNLAVRLETGDGVVSQPSEAVRWYRLAAEAGDVDAQYNLGVLTGRGYGTAQDDAAAVQWFLRAAEQGDAQAQLVLGFRYREGVGVAADEEAAAQWFIAAAEQNVPEAQLIVGKLHVWGIGVRQNLVTGWMWLQRAACAGELEAAEVRDRVATVMTAGQIEKAQALVNLRVDETNGAGLCAMSAD